MVTSPAAAFKWALTNDLDQKVYFSLYWESHPYDRIGPASIAGGEVAPKASFALESEWPAGDYFIVWSDPKDQWAHSCRMDLTEITSAGIMVKVRLRDLPVKINVIEVGK
jgi:hypothetical protein